jgi:DNA-binding NarL/FixJ family response regulator
MTGRDPAEPDPTAQVLRQQTHETLEHTARLFRSIAGSARSTGDLDRAAHLERLADEAERRLGRTAPPGHGSAAGPPRPSPAATRVLLVDDHELAREALRSVLTAEQGFRVVGEAADGQQAVRLARQLRPELVLMDVRLPGMDGLEATRAVLAELPATKVVVLTSYEQRPIVLDALRAGAAGYVLKGASKQEVLEIIRTALAGERRIQGSLAADLLDQDAQGTAHVLSVPLSQREVEVIRLMAAGQSNAAIARALHVSLNTVKTHVQHVVRKLEAADRASAVARAAALGLLANDGPPAPR